MTNSLSFVDLFNFISWIKPQLEGSEILDFYILIWYYLTFFLILLENFAAIHSFGKSFENLSISYEDSYWSLFPAVWNWPDISLKYSPPWDSLGRSLLPCQYFLKNAFPLVLIFLLSEPIIILSMLPNFASLFLISG